MIQDIINSESSMNATESTNTNIFKTMYRNMYLKKAWYHKTYIDTNSSIDFEKLH